MAVASYESDRAVSLVAGGAGLLCALALIVLMRPGRPARVDGVSMGVAVYRRGGVRVREEGAAVDTSRTVSAERTEGVDAEADRAWR